MTEPKIEFVGESGPEPVTVEELARLTITRALHDAVCPSGSRCDSPTTWDRRWFQTAEVAVAALAKSDLLRGRILAALSAPSEPVRPEPRVLGTAGQFAILAAHQLNILRGRGPLTEVVEP